MASIQALKNSNIVKRHCKILHQAASVESSVQIRNMATLGGNICNASPAGDMILPLLALDAELELIGGGGTRRLALADFFTGPGATVLEPGELLVAIRVPKPSAGHIGAFRKFGPRPALEIAIAAVAITGNLKGGTISNPRVAFGAVAPTPLRGRGTEAVLEGKKLDANIITAAGQAASAEVSPISDTRASADYRRHLVRVLAEEILSHVAQI